STAASSLTSGARRPRSARLGFRAGRFAAFGGELGDGRERRGIGDGEIGEDLTIDADVRGFQSADEARVGRAVGARGGVDACDPETAKIALPALATDVRVLPGFVNDLDGDGEQARSTAPEAFGVVEDAVSAPTRLESTFGSRHGSPH